MRRMPALGSSFGGRADVSRPSRASSATPRGARAPWGITGNVIAHVDDVTARVNDVIARIEERRDDEDQGDTKAARRA